MLPARRLRCFGPRSRLRFARFLDDRHRAETVGSRQDDLGSPHDLGRGVVIGYELLNPKPVRGAHVEGNVLSHATSMTDLRKQGNRPSVTEY